MQIANLVNYRGVTPPPMSVAALEAGHAPSSSVISVVDDLVTTLPACEPD